MNVWIHTYFFSHYPSTFCFSAPHWTDDLHWADNAYFQISTYGLNMHCYNYWKLFNFSLDPWYFPSETKQQLSQTKHSRPANASWPLSSFGIILRTLYLLHLVKTKQNKQTKKKKNMWCSGFYMHLLEPDFHTVANSLFLQVFLQCYYITCGSLLCWLGSFS